MIIFALTKAHEFELDKIQVLAYTLEVFSAINEKEDA